MKRDDDVDPLRYLIEGLFLVAGIVYFVSGVLETWATFLYARRLMDAVESLVRMSFLQ